MRRFELHRTCLGKIIAAQTIVLDKGVHISLYGGDMPHIGAVGILDPAGNLSVTQFPGHQEGMICEQWLKALAAAKIVPAVLEAGIHYDGLTPAGIQKVLCTADRILEELLWVLTESLEKGETLP